MTYEEIAKYIFSEERVDWELHKLKDRHRQLVLARQIAIYIAHWFYPAITNRELGEIFGQDHANANHSIKSVSNLLFSDKELRSRVDKYLIILREKIRNENQELIQSQMNDEKFKKKLTDAIDQMEMIAKVYADMTGMKLIKNN
jgi:hypothetical protein